MSVDRYRLSVAIVLLGSENDFTKKLTQLNKLDMNDFKEEILIFKWLNSK